MPRRRAHISLETKLASALLALGHIPYLHAKLMSAAQIISLYEFHHDILHSQDGSDHFSNLTPLGIIQHRHHTRTIDVPQAARSKHLIKARAALDHFLATGEKPERPANKRKIPSRPFPKFHRPLRSRSSFERRA
jgi:hypothetical protein